MSQQHYQPTSPPPQPGTSSYPNNYIPNPLPANNWNMNQNNFQPQHYQQQFQQPGWNQGAFYGQYQPQPSDGFYNGYQQYQRFNNSNNNYTNFNHPHQNYNNHRNNNNNNNNNFKKNFYNNNNKNNKNTQKRNFNEDSQITTNQPQFQSNIYNNNNNKKQKVEDKVEFFCEICDREFKTDEKYQEHLATHRTCGVNGCKFVAAEKLVKIHFQNFHASGVDKKVPALNTPEEIEKYRNERKKNFPTHSNVEKKAQLDEEMCERGAVLETQQFGKFNKNKKRNLNANEENKEATVLSEAPSVDATQPNKNNRNKNRNKNKNQRGKVELKSGFPSRKPTLLQQLLADEIRHERNVLLQCVRYIVDKNFFEPEKQQPIEAKAC